MGRGPITIKPKGRPASGGRGRGSVKGGSRGNKGSLGGGGRGVGGSNSSVMNTLRGGNAGGGRGSSSTSTGARPTEQYSSVALARGQHYTKAPVKSDARGNYDDPASPLSGGNSPRNSGSSSSGSSTRSDAGQPQANQAMDGGYMAAPAPAQLYHGQVGGNGTQPIYSAPPVTGPAAGGGGNPPPPPPGGGNNPPPPGGGNNPPPGGGNNQNNNPGQPFGGMGVQNQQPQQSRASKILQKIKPESKKGAAAYGSLALLVVGAGTSPLWFPAIKEAIDNNGSMTPTADDTKIIGDRANNEKSPVDDIDLTKLFSPLDNEPGSKIDPTSFLLFKTVEISEEGAKSIDVNGTWIVTDAGILSFSPDQDVDFGTVSIAYTVQDMLGRTSNYGEVQIVYGPFVGNITRRDLAPDKKTPAISITDIYDPASPAAKSKIDLTTVQLVQRIDGIAKTGDTITTQDGSTWRVENGKITYEPSPGFISTNVNIGFLVRDKEGLLSNEGQIALFFKPKSMVKPPVGGSDKPKLAFAPEIAVNTQDVTFAISSVGQLKASSLEISASPTGTFGKSIDAGREGQWSVQGNALNYKRGAGFRDAPTTIYYRATSKSGVASDVFALVLGIFPPPQAFDVTKQGLRAMIDVLPSTEVRYRRENNAIDATSLRFLSVAPADASDPTPVLSADGKLAEVTDEGTWSVIEKNSKVRFVPVRGFSRQPTAMFYTVRDSKGSESNPAKIVLSKAADDVRKMIADMMLISPREFETRLKTVMAGKPLSDVLVVCFQLRNLFYSQMNEAQRMMLRAEPEISAEERDRIFMVWMDSGFNFGTLVDETEKIEKTSPGQLASRNNLGPRVLRLEEIMRALDRYFDALEAAM